MEDRHIEAGKPVSESARLDRRRLLKRGLYVTGAGIAAVYVAPKVATAVGGAELSPWAGACCVPGGEGDTCIELDQAACDSQGGTWNDGVPCDQNPCP